MPYTRARARSLATSHITSFHASKAVPSVVHCSGYVRNLHWVLLLLAFLSIGMCSVISIAIYCVIPHC